MTYDAVAESYGVGRYSVAQWRIQLDVAGKRVPTPSEGDLRVLIDGGASNRKIADQFGVSESAVGKWRRKRGLPDVIVKMPSKEALMRLVEKYPNIEIAKIYGVGLRTISKWRKRLGLANVWPKDIVDWGEFDKDSVQMRWREVCEKYGISLSVMQLWKQQRGLTNGKMNDRVVTWVEDGNGCWICTSHAKDDMGYPGNRGDIAKKVWVEKNGVWPEDKVVMHDCDNKLCVNPSHVRPGTIAENQREMAERDRSPWGERNGVRKLTANQAREIYALKGSGTMKSVAEKFGVSEANVWYIWNGKTWVRDIQGMENFPVKLTEVLAGKKLTWSEVKSIRSMKGRMSARSVAKVYRITHPMVMKIWRNESWKVKS
jgi:uncharacterized protein YjcR